jgi:hypothetical protein
MSSLRFLLPACICIIVSGCAALTQQWRETYCSREGGYRLGVEHASTGLPMQAAQSAYNCDASVRSAMDEGYREGYASVARSEQPAPPPTQSVQAEPPPAEPASVSPPPAASSTAPAEEIRCCVNGSYYGCPDTATLDRCAGAFSRCMTGCMSSSDMSCPDRCFESHPPDPSVCRRDSDRDSLCR